MLLLANLARCLDLTTYLLYNSYSILSKSKN